MPKVAVLTYKREFCDNGLDKLVESHCTDWTEVSEEEYKLLYSYLDNTHGYKQVRHLVLLDETTRVPKLIEECIAIAEENKRKDLDKKNRDAKAKKTRELKKLQDKKAMLEKLKKELGEDVSSD